MSAYLANLTLRTFRNYAALDLALAPGVSVFVGRNGQGKSNVLEAVCYLALLRSFWAQNIGILRQWGADGFAVEGRLDCTEGDSLGKHALFTQFGERRLLRLDGNPVERASDFINQFQCVPLVSEDIDLIRGAARERRWFLNIFCSLVQPGYLGHLQALHEAIRFRNAVLWAGDAYPKHVLAAYDELLIKHGAEIEAVRGQVVDRLNEHLGKVAGRLFVDGPGALAVEYSSFADERLSVADLATAYREVLVRSQPRDAKEGRTSVEPHLANLNLHLAGRPVARYGSEGKCRLTALALRLASLGVIREPDLRDRAVVLLVDNVFGELDPHRREAFFHCVAEADQVLITATEYPPELPTEGTRVFHVQAGDIHP